MSTGVFGKDRIENPEMWNLLLRVGVEECLHAVIYSVVEENSLMSRRIDLDSAASSRLHAIESAVYDNPVLLSDFRQVTVVVESRETLAVPAECVDESSREMLFRTAFPESVSTVTADPTGTRNAVLLTGVDPELRRFITRTYRSARITSHLGSLCRYFAARAGQGNKTRMVVNVRRKSVDVIALDSHRLLMANTFDVGCAADAAYYILACRRQLGLDPSVDDLYFSGDPEAREELMPLLRAYIARVVPVIFPPQMFKAGKEAMSAPFDLIVAPLCE